MRNVGKWVVLSMALLLMLVCWGCSTSDTADGGGTVVDPSGAEQKVVEANEALELVLYDMINAPEPEEPSELDFTVPYGLYNEALALDPANADANFGAGLCGLMMITQDTEINQAWDEWSAFLDTTELFEPPGGAGLQGCQPSLPGFPSFQELSNLPPAMVPAAIGGMVAMAASSPPMFSDLQNLIENELLPRLQEAYNRLEVVDDDPAYVFTVTPQMQGDPEEDSVELDLTEIYAMEVSLLVADAFARILISYNVDFASYDSLGLLQAFQQNASNSFLKLRSGGAGHLAMSKSNLITALNKAKTGISFLENETDYQGDDIIVIEPENQEDLDSIKASIDYALEALDGNWSYTTDWDNDPLTPEVEVTFNLASFFDNPISDFKALLPDYEVSIEVRPDDYWYEYHYDSQVITDNVDIPMSGYYYWERYYSHYEGEPGSSYFDANLSIPGFEQAFDTAMEEMLNDPNISSFWLSLYWSGTYEEGLHVISSPLSMEWHENVGTGYQYVVVLTYTAGSFSEWIFPNPTFNGLLPGMTDASLKTIFGFDEDAWLQGLEFSF